MSAATSCFAPGTVVLVTGASSGIGAAVARHLGGRGCRLALCARRPVELEAVARDVEAAGGAALALPGDVASLADARAAHARAARELGPVEVAFLNAGIGDFTTITRFDAAQIRRLFEVNVLGVVNWLDTLLPAMVARRRGVVVGTSSLARDRGLPTAGAYSASKAAVSVLFESLRVEGARHGVRVVTFEPGFIRTPLTDQHRFHMPFLLEADDAAARLCREVAAGASVVRFPLPLSLLSRASAMMPAAVADRVIATVTGRQQRARRAVESSAAPAPAPPREEAEEGERGERPPRRG